MSKVKYFQKTAHRVLEIFLPLLPILLVTSRCEDAPAGPEPTRWRVITEAPAGAIDLYGTAANNILLIGGEERAATAWRWDGNRVTAVYRYPKVNSPVAAIDGRDGAIWLAGWRDENGRTYGILIKNENGVWDEVSPTPRTKLGSWNVSAAPAGCWLTGYDEIFSHLNGQWSYYGPYLGLDGVLYQNENNIFAWDTIQSDLMVFWGNDWRREEIKLPPPYEPGLIEIGVSAGTVVYFNTRLNFGRDDYYPGIVRREGDTSGHGEY